MSKRPSDQESGQSDKRKRLNLASVVAEAVKYDELQKLCQSLEPLLRRVVGEEIDRAMGSFRKELAETRRAAPDAVPATRSEAYDEPIVGTLRLQFKNKVAMSLFTGSKVEGEHGSPVYVLLQDAETGQIVTTGPEAELKLEIIVLDGDFSADDEGSWTQEDFSSHEVREREGKGPLLTGDSSVLLKDGIGTLGELSFSDNSSWIRSRRFRLGAKVAGGSSYQGQKRIREAKSDAFVVKDHRGELYKKHYPPELHDEVWRLDKIGKDGAFHRRLYKAGVRTVEDFLRLAVMDPQRLRNILGSGMSNKMWEGTMEHAKTCVLSQKLYVYYADEKHNVGIIFNTIYQLMGLTSDARYLSADSLSESEKVYVEKLVKVAYENWGRVIEYEGEPIAELREVHHPKLLQSEGHQQPQQQSSSIVVRPSTSLPSTPMVFQPWSPLVASTPSNDWLFYKDTRSPAPMATYTSGVEDEVMRARSLEFLENEEINRQMKQLLLMLAGGGSSNISSNAAGGKALGGRGRWLKIRAAITWSIYIRNIAAARRAKSKTILFK